MNKPIKLDDSVSALKAAADPTRLRLLALLAAGEATVGELQAVLAQSQPRVSRHLRILSEAGLADVSSPRTVVGDGTAASCTGEAVIAAVAAGGVLQQADVEHLAIGEPAQLQAAAPSRDASTLERGQPARSLATSRPSRSVSCAACRGWRRPTRHHRHRHHQHLRHHRHQRHRRHHCSI